MSKRKRRKHLKDKESFSAAALVVAIVATAITLFCFSGEFDSAFDRACNTLASFTTSFTAKQKASQTDSETAPGIAASSKNLTVNFINVGDGDSILLERGGYGMLIDAGSEEAADTVVKYIKSQKLNKLDFCIGTHPHEDHVGGLDSVINNFSVSTLIMPNVSASTNSFSDVEKTIKKKKLKITRPAVGKTYKFEGATFTVLAPNSTGYDDINNYSVVIRFVYGSTSFLFTGDAGKISEKEMLKNGCTLKSDVLKVGHHGSSTSTSADFLNAVDPKYAVISVGNDYKGLPAKTTVSRLKKAGIKVYRTDQDGTVTAVSDGKKITFKTDAVA